jgi:hypothetical protein
MYELLEDKMRLQLKPACKTGGVVRRPLNQLILSLIFLLAWSHTSLAATPTLFFSDMTDGATYGWNGSSSQGAAVTVWGLNLGSSRGTSTLTVCGVTLNQDSQFAEWGATTNPTTARGEQRITFWLTSGMTAGAGTIQVNNGSNSNPIPFNCRTPGSNHIYFASKLDGNDSYDGLAPTHGTGSHGPWLTTTKIRTALTAGDVAYLRGNGTGIFNDLDSDPNNGSHNSIFNFEGANHANGIANKSIVVASYPGEVAQLGTISSPYYVWRFTYDNGGWNYWTFSKFNVRANNSNLTYWAQQDSVPQVISPSDHLRWIGMDLCTVAPSQSTGAMLEFAGSQYSSGNQNGTAQNFSIYGNYIHDAGTCDPNVINHYRNYGLYLDGYGNMTNFDIGWNEIAHNTDGRGIQVYCHTAIDRIDQVRIHDNWIHDNGLTGIVAGGGDPGSGSNYQCVGTEYVYNNIISNNGWAGSNDLKSGGYYAGLNAPGQNTGSGGTYYIYNNTFSGNYYSEIDIDQPPTTNGHVYLVNNIFNTTAAAKTANSSYDIVVYEFGSMYGNNNTTCSVCSGSQYNLFFGNGGNGPTWSTSSLNTNPLFTNSSPVSYVDYNLQGTSPAINAGFNALSTISALSLDFRGVPRPSSPTGYTIGAYEYNSNYTYKTRPMAPVLNP